MILNQLCILPQEERREHEGLQGEWQGWPQGRSLQGQLLEGVSSSRP